MKKRHDKLVGEAAEIAILRTIRQRTSQLGGGGLRLGIGDDCALLRVKPDEEIAVTTDLSIEGRHFRLDWHAPESIGHRTLARGLSDLAAMGARPVAAFLSLGLPGELTAARGRQAAWIERFYDGFLALACDCKTPLAGGDLAESSIAVADVVLAGAVPAGRALLRSGARPGDNLYVTGTLGGAAAGLQQVATLARKRKTRPVRIPRGLEEMLKQHLYPQPRLAQGLWLRKRGIASGAIDISDGLSTDVMHICVESGVWAVIESAALPVAAGATLEQALHGGEDYELLFTARPAVRLPKAIGGVAVTRIGHVTRMRPRTPRVLLRMAAGVEALEPRGWEHFSK